MGYFSKLEHIAHYKAKNQNSQNSLSLDSYNRFSIFLTYSVV